MNRQDAKDAKKIEISPCPSLSDFGLLVLAFSIVASSVPSQ
jgi:hypothetical protein